MTDKVSVIHGDSRSVLQGYEAKSFDSCVTDPPYALVSITKRFGKEGAAPAKGNSAYMRASSGFMGQQWDTGETAFDPEFWREVYRVLKPGAHLVAFSGTRTYHRMVCAIEDAGFEIRDMISWLYGSGFPKSHNAGDGWGTALKPACEPIVLARKPLIGTVAENVLEHGTGALNIDGCRIEAIGRPAREIDPKASANGAVYAGRQKAGTGFDGGSKAVGTTDQGRWPANIIHDGSEEVLAGFPDSAGQQGLTSGNEPSDATADIYGKFKRVAGQPPRGDSGSAARFFYTAKADADDRLGSSHPTVKPVDLMQWLVRLVTKRGGLVLDPFAGTGTTGEACIREGMRAVLIEREERFVADIRRRMSLAMSGADERSRESVKAKIASGRLKDDPGPLFS